MSHTIDAIRRRITQINQTDQEPKRLHCSQLVHQELRRQVRLGYFKKVPVKVVDTSSDSKFWAITIKTE